MLLKLGVSTLGELSKFPVQDLMSHFGPRAKVLQEIAQGKDPVPFQPRQMLEFSWGKDFTTAVDLYEPIAGPRLQPYLAAGEYPPEAEGRGKLPVNWC